MFAGFVLLSGQAGCCCAKLSKLVINRDRDLLILFPATLWKCVFPSSSDVQYHVSYNLGITMNYKMPFVAQCKIEMLSDTDYTVV